MVKLRGMVRGFRGKVMVDGNTYALNKYLKELEDAEYAQEQFSLAMSDACDDLAEDMDKIVKQLRLIEQLDQHLQDKLEDEVEKLIEKFEDLKVDIEDEALGVKYQFDEWNMDFDYMETLNEIYPTDVFKYIKEYY